MKKVLFLSGGWDGHQPDKFVHLLSEALTSSGLECDIVKSLDILADVEKLKTYAAVSPCWTMGSLTKDQSEGLCKAVHEGLGLGGIHGGMGDAFRGDTSYEWMTGGHFVGHPHVGPYEVSIKDFASPITEGLPPQFSYDSEQYYMLVDPGVHVLADSRYVYEGRACTMPIAWIKMWGSGRVFYSSLGHDPAEFTKFAEALTLSVRGIRWAAGAL